jgi:hypothetical protein
MGRRVQELTLGRDAKRNHAAHPDRAPKPGGTSNHAIEAANLAELARQIVDLEHFDAIVAQVQPLMRSRVRKLLSAHVSFHVPEPLSTYVDIPRPGSTRVDTARPGSLHILRYDDNGE